MSTHIASSLSKRLSALFAAALILAFCCGNLHAQATASYSTAGSTYTQNFDTLDNGTTTTAASFSIGTGTATSPVEFDLTTNSGGYTGNTGMSGWYVELSGGTSFPGFRCC